MKVETRTKTYTVLIYTTQELKELDSLEDVIDTYPTFAIDGFREKMPEQWELSPEQAALAGLIGFDDIYKYD